VNEYIFSMYRADKFYGPDRQVLANISLSFIYGAKIGVLGPNGAGKSTLLRIMAGREETSSGDAQLAPSATVGLLEQEPELDDAKDVRATSRTASASCATSSTVSRPSRRASPSGRGLRRAAREQAKVQDEIDRREGWSLDATLDRAMDALRVPYGDRDVTTLSGGERRRVALCRLLLSSPTCCCSTSRRTTSTPSRSAGSSASLRSTKDGRRGHARSLLPRQRRPAGILELDRGRGIPFRGTTRRGSSRSRPGSPSTRRRNRPAAARSRASSSGCA